MKINFNSCSLSNRVFIESSAPTRPLLQTFTESPLCNAISLTVVVKGQGGGLCKGILISLTALLTGPKARRLSQAQL